ncbi:MAG: (d)CMP kinase [Phycisphaerales bacterium]|nr:(d)CMP kinase [Phycisphaerales bacterium]
MTGRPASLIITIDGPAGAGKSAVARLVAKRLGFHFLDTGAMYRAAVAVAIAEGIPLTHGKAIADAVQRVTLRFDWDTDPPKLYAGDVDVSQRVRDADVSCHVSPVSALPELRRVLVTQQRAIAREHGRLVTEGRDQGSIVFPDAGLKVYLDASPHIRAARRAQQLRDAGREADEQQILAGIMRRDQGDSTRADSPLVQPRGAIILDTTSLSLDEVVDHLEALALQRMAEIDCDGNEGFSDAHTTTE